MLLFISEKFLNIKNIQSTNKIHENWQLGFDSQMGFWSSLAWECAVFVIILFLLLAGVPLFECINARDKNAIYHFLSN
jgi:hypothetical protein